MHSADNAGISDGLDRNSVEYAKQSFEVGVQILKHAAKDKNILSILESKIGKDMARFVINFIAPFKTGPFNIFHHFGFVSRDGTISGILNVDIIVEYTRNNFIITKNGKSKLDKIIIKTPSFITMTQNAENFIILFPFECRLISWG